MNGIPHLEMVKVCSASSNHTSNHKEARFNVIGDPMFELSENPILTNLSIQSVFLTKYRGSSRIFYGSEASVQSCVYDLLVDILRLTGDETELILMNETTIAPTNNGETKIVRPDIWLLQWLQGRPIAVFEVKSPDVTNVVNHPKVIGQMFDYMTKLRSFC
jgi:hypothetical protein